jgi:hypothetical protein
VNFNPYSRTEARPLGTLPVCALVFACASAVFGSVVQSATCLTNGTYTYGDPSCSAAAPAPTDTQAEATTGLLGDTVTASAQASINPNQDGGFGEAFADIESEEQLYFNTPVRPGYAFISIVLAAGSEVVGTAYTGVPVPAAGDSSGAVGPYSLQCDDQQAACSMIGYYPIELGVPFSVTMSAGASAVASSTITSSSAQAAATVSFLLYEVSPTGGPDLSSSVQFLTTPEPSLTGLVGASLLGLLVLRRQRQRLL